MIEGDEALGSLLRMLLEAEGHSVHDEREPAAAKRALAEVDFDVAIIDMDVEERELELLRLARTAKPAGGIVALLSSRQTADRIAVLDAGGDDCLVKPISVQELCSRLRALGRRLAPPTRAVLRVADLQLNRLERRVERCGRAIELTPKEFALLEFLMCNTGAPLPRAAILQHVWNFGIEANTNLVDVYINYLRKKIDDEFSPKLIQTVRGVGYQVAAGF
jgi:DNA-binding response OmpR family regulator